MNLARRVRDCRYAKGWGPDELASRAEISRTALYQIECGKTETPRAATLRRIAAALEIPVDALISDGAPQLTSVRASREPERPAPAPAPIAAAVRLDAKPASSMEALDLITGEGEARAALSSLARRRDLERKFHDILASPLGDSLARIVEESHRLLPAWQARKSV